MLHNTHTRVNNGSNKRVQQLNVVTLSACRGVLRGLLCEADAIAKIHYENFKLRANSEHHLNLAKMLYRLFRVKMVCVTICTIHGVARVHDAHVCAQAIR